jgi:recombinational DNA repair protein (RecF pathway)
MSQKIYQNGYIIDNKNYSQTSSIITIFSSLEIKTAIVKGSRSKSKLNQCNLGNEVSFTHFGRDGSLGVFAVEATKNPIINNIDDSQMIFCIFSACELILNLVNESFCEYSLLYLQFESFIDLATKRSPLYLSKFYDLERTIIKYCGYNSFDKNHSNVSDSYNDLLKAIDKLGVCESKFFYRKQLNAILGRKQTT